MQRKRSALNKEDGKDREEIPEEEIHEILNIMTKNSEQDGKELQEAFDRYCKLYDEGKIK